MQITSMHFKAAASAKLADANLQSALNRLQGNFVRGRARAGPSCTGREAARM
jgi:hypothetical protein